MLNGVSRIVRNKVCTSEMFLYSSSELIQCIFFKLYYARHSIVLMMLTYNYIF